MLISSIRLGPASSLDFFCGDDKWLGLVPDLRLLLKRVSKPNQISLLKLPPEKGNPEPGVEMLVRCS